MAYAVCESSWAALRAQPRVIRVFPRRTSHTPSDGMAFVGDPSLWVPEADEVHISCTFTWDIREAERLQQAWQPYAPVVRLGGPAFGSPTDGFTAGLYVRQGITFTSRGCPRRCPFCLVPDREGPLRLLPIMPGRVVGDNNFLACPPSHRKAVYQMLSAQRRAAVFSGGLQASLVTDEIADELRGLRISEVFLAADSEGAVRPLREATRRLSFLGRQKLRCYVLCGYDGETIQQAETRLEAVWDAGCLPFAQLYQAPTPRRTEYSADWRRLQKAWSRPAATKAMHR